MFALTFSFVFYIPILIVVLKYWVTVIKKKKFFIRKTVIRDCTVSILGNPHLKL